RSIFLYFASCRFEPPTKIDSGGSTSGARSSCSQHAALCVDDCSVYAGIWSLHTCIAYGQRAANGQPLGGSNKFGGVPGIDCNSSVSSCSFGIEDSRPQVYGCFGS